ncbi:hypothetical protein KAU08_00195 [bacterium]|nr:hypothetical protein [bacterium]
MSNKKTPLLALISLIVLFTAFGCGSPESNPAIPSIDNSEPITHGAELIEGSQVIAAFDLVIDPVTGTVDFVENRSADTHYNITVAVGPHSIFSITSWDPLTGLLIFDLSMKNPTVYDIYDLRALLLTPPGSGWEMLNLDDYTKLFNPYGPGVVNPFVAYGTSVPARTWGGGITLTEELRFQAPVPGPFPPASLLIECSFPSNCEDPYEIRNQTVSNPINSSTPAVITVTSLDHQNNIVAVSVDTTPITGGMTSLSPAGLDNYTANVVNSMGAPVGIYKCLIISDSFATNDNLYDFVDIEVIADTATPGTWHGTDYPLTHDGCSLDLGVIADPGGPRDSEILMASDGVTNCDAVIKYDANYAAWNYYVSTVTTLDPNVASYDAHPIERIDAADDGAFSFTNSNWSDLFAMTASGPVYYAQVWNVLDNNPKLHTGPYPDDSRYWNDLNYDCFIYPIDVCDDFALGQHALFTSGTDYTPEDLTFLGVMPDSYTYDKVRYYGNLDPFAGIGTGLTNSLDVRGIDVIEGVEESPTHADVYDSATLYVLENNTDMFQVEVYRILDTVASMGWDTVYYVMTINIDEYAGTDLNVEGKDIEILPINPHYKLNPNDPTLCVLVSYFDWSGKINGEVFLYNAATGVFLESIGDISTSPALPHHRVQFLDTDDGDWEIHVTSINPAGNTVATIFSY